MTNRIYCFYGMTAETVGVEPAILLECLAMLYRHGKTEVTLREMEHRLPFWNREKIDDVIRRLVARDMAEVLEGGEVIRITPAGDNLVKEAIGRREY